MQVNHSTRYQQGSEIFPYSPQTTPRTLKVPRLFEVTLMPGMGRHLFVRGKGGQGKGGVNDTWRPVISGCWRLADSSHPIVCDKFTLKQVDDNRRSVVHGSWRRSDSTQAMVCEILVRPRPGNSQQRLTWEATTTGTPNIHCAEVDWTCFSNSYTQTSRRACAQKGYQSCVSTQGTSGAVRRPQILREARNKIIGRLQIVT